MRKDTIIALASGQGKAGIAVIRISGEKALAILREMNHNKHEFVPNMLTPVSLYLDNLVEHGMAVYFKAPKSFTGEDVVEINCHGGKVVIDKVINRAIALGAVMANRGEFSLRAFMNGKISIDQAEGICDLVSAESDKQAQYSSALLTGKLKDKVVGYQDKIKDILASIEAKIDYPEYEIDQSEIDGLKGSLRAINGELRSLIDSYDEGKKVLAGVQVAIVGSANAGKSSLLNALTGQEIAIVSDIAGTTRDVLFGQYQYNGVIFQLYDTAGIRDSKDVIEKIGIDRAIKKMDEADIILNVVTPDEPNTLTERDNMLVVFNKADKYTYADGLKISTKTGQGIDELKQKLYEMSFRDELVADKLYITNARHLEGLVRANKALLNAQNNLDIVTLDAIATDLKYAWQALGEITGETASEEIISRIFEKFCLGK